MRKWKRGLATALAALMLVALLPVNALAAEAGAAGTVVETGETGGGNAGDAPTDEPGDGNAPTDGTDSEDGAADGDAPTDKPEDDAPAADGNADDPDEEPGEKAPEQDAADEVIYNLRDMEITVGSDEAIAEAGELPYALFDEDGDYTIEIAEPEPFFPYEVQFTYQGNTFCEWFQDADDTVEVGGHTFRVDCVGGEPNYIHFIVGGETIPAMPEEKVFTNDGPGIAPISLLPLEHSSYSVGLYDKFRSELKNVKLDVLLGSHDGDVAGDAAIVWAKRYDDDKFTIADRDTTIDLSEETSVTLELIVGTADQLDPGNKRYLVSVYSDSSKNLLSLKPFNQDGDEIEIFDDYFYPPSASRATGYYWMRVNGDDWTEGPAYWSMDFGTHGALDNPENIDVAVYPGAYASMQQIEQAKVTPITDQIWRKTGKEGYLADSGADDQMPQFTAVFRRDGSVVEVFPFGIEMQEAKISYSLSTRLYKESDSGTRFRATDYYDYSIDDRTYEYAMYSSSYPIDGTYYFDLTCYPADFTENAGTQGINLVDSAYVGNFEKKENVPAGAEDIKAQLFSDSETDGGYGADYSKGVTFTVFLKKGSAAHFTIKTTPYIESQYLPSAPTPLEKDTYFHMNSASKTAESDNSYNSYTMNYADDSYYYNGYQTVFLLGLDENSQAAPVAEGTEIFPSFDSGRKVTVFAGHDQMSGEKQISGTTPATFKSGKAIHYSAAAENGKHLKNYWVTFVTQQSGAKLFVNGATNSEHRDETTGNPVREVFLDNAHGNHHDIFFANIGDETLSGLSVTLSDAQNVQLDPYWTINATKTLAAFDTVSGRDPTGLYDRNGELKNVAKIRLIPTENKGVISGTLTIRSANGGSETIKLTGVSGVPKITTETLVQGVKYVPYSSLIQTNNMYDPDAVAFELAAGTLPAGVRLKPNGEIYGVPKTFGTWKITVRAKYTDDPSLYDEKEFTLEILDNTNVNVWNATDGNYEITTWVGEETTPSTQMPAGDETKYYLLTDSGDQNFVTEGLYGDFIDFWLDGRQLTLGTEYQAESGSTKIMILSQTIKNAGNGKHTISAEFREGDPQNGTLKRAAQNYYIQNLPSSSGGNRRPSNGDTGGGAGVNSSGGTTTKKPAKPKPQTPEKNPQPSDEPFVDCRSSDWFYDNVLWAYEEELMMGVSTDRFAPVDPISQAIVVSVLSRLSGEDMTPYKNESDPDVASGEWYTAAAIWAKRVGLLPDYSRFLGEGAYARGQMAVMLAKYLTRIGIDTDIPEDGASFADAALMDEEELRAFRILYHYQIFQGVGGMQMNPTGTTSRAEFAALIHRISKLADEQA